MRVKEKVNKYINKDSTINLTRKDKFKARKENRLLFEFNIDNTFSNI